jgi:O-antigen/teichoic acid export membrane protein
MLKFIRTNKTHILVALYKALGALSFILAGIYVSNVYGAAAFGYYSAFYTAVVIQNMFGKAGLDIYLLRYGTEHVGKDTYGSLLRTLLFKFTVVFHVVFFVFLALLQAVSQDSLIYRELYRNVAILYTSSLLMSFSDIFVEQRRIDGNLPAYAANRFLSTSVTTLLALPILHHMGLSNYGIEAIMTGSIVYALITASSLPVSAVAYTAERYTDKVLKISVKMMAIGSAMYVMGYLDTFVISYYLSPEHNARYAAIMRLSSALTFLTSIVITVRARGIVTEHVSKNSLRQHFGTTAKQIFLIAMPTYVALMIFARPLLGIYGEAYMLESSVFYVYCTASLVTTIPFGYYFVLTDNQSTFLIIITLALLLNALLNVALVPVYGLVAAAITTLTSNVVWNVLAFYWLKRKEVI